MLTLSVKNVTHLMLDRHYRECSSRCFFGKLKSAFNRLLSIIKSAVKCAFFSVSCSSICQNYLRDFVSLIDLTAKAARSSGTENIA